MKTVYMAMSADFIHPGHIQIIKKASELGQLTVGVIVDAAVATYKRMPILNYQQRAHIIENIKGVHQVIPQKSIDYTENLLLLKPNYVVHGNDWKTGSQSSIRQKVIDILKQWDGQLIEPEYAKEYATAEFAASIATHGITPARRLSRLRELLAAKPVIRLLEVHNGLTGLIAEKTKRTDGMQTVEFDGMWESSLTDSTSKGKPDTNAVDISSRILTIDQILDVTTKPMVVDADNGGLPEHFKFTVRTLERLGVSAVIIEDKIGPKRNSLFGTDVEQLQDSIEEFSFKISAGKKAQVTKDFMIIARIESLILKQGQQDALARAQAFVNAGADGIMIHSKEKDATEVLEFCKAFQKLGLNVPLVAVPSTYASITESELNAVGVKIVIYANHMLRSAFPAMQQTALSILQHGRCLEASKQHCMPIKEIITLIPESL